MRGTGTGGGRSLSNMMRCADSFSSKQCVPALESIDFNGALEDTLFASFRCRWLGVRG